MPFRRSLVPQFVAARSVHRHWAECCGIEDPGADPRVQNPTRANRVSGLRFHAGNIAAELVGHLEGRPASDQTLSRRCANRPNVFETHTLSMGRSGRLKQLCSLDPRKSRDRLVAEVIARPGDDLIMEAILRDARGACRTVADGEGMLVPR
jgi:hypothetical protein